MKRVITLNISLKEIVADIAKGQHLSPNYTWKLVDEEIIFSDEQETNFIIPTSNHTSVYTIEKMVTEILGKTDKKELKIAQAVEIIEKLRIMKSVDPTERGALTRSLPFLNANTEMKLIDLLQMTYQDVIRKNKSIQNSKGGYGKSTHNALIRIFKGFDFNDNPYPFYEL